MASHKELKILITSKLGEYFFKPKNITINDLLNDANGNDFTGIYTIREYMVSGRVRDDQGEPLLKILLKGFELEVRTDENGTDRSVVASAWSGTISGISCTQLLTCIHHRENVGGSYYILCRKLG